MGLLVACLRSPPKCQNIVSKRIYPSTRKGLIRVNCMKIIITPVVFDFGVCVVTSLPLLWQILFCAWPYNLCLNGARFPYLRQILVCLVFVKKWKPELIKIGRLDNCIAVGGFYTWFALCLIGGIKALCLWVKSRRVNIARKYYVRPVIWRAYL
jgi:hypothetical protein